MWPSAVEKRMKKMAASAETNTHTAPPRTVTKAPPALWGRGGMPRPRHRQSRYRRGCPYSICAEVPVPLIVLAVIMAANRQHPVAIWTGRNALWTISPLRRGCGSFISGATWQLGEVRRHAAGLVAVSRLVRGREQNDPVAERSLGSFAVFDV